MTIQAGDAKTDRPAGRAQIRSWEERDRESLLRLRPRAYLTWPDAGLTDWHRRIDRWFDTNPLVEHMRRWVVDDGGEIVGHLAAVPFAYRIGGRRIVAHTPTDYMALPAYGFHAAGLMRTFFRSCPDYVACNVAGHVSEIERRFGSTVVTELTSALKPANLAAYPRLPRRIPRPVARLASLSLRSVDRLLALRRSRDITTEEEGSIRGEFDELFERAAAAVACIPEKDAAFLRWRYGREAPQAPVTILAARGAGALVGYACLYTSSRGEGYILDLMTLPGRPDVARSLLIDVVGRFWRDRVFTIRYRFVPAAVGPSPALLRSLGFVIRGGTGARLAAAGSEPRRELLVRFGDPATNALGVGPENWSYNLGDGEASFWVR